MTEIPRETRVLDAVVSLVDSLLDDFDVVDLLTSLTEHCARCDLETIPCARHPHNLHVALRRSAAVQPIERTLQ